MHVTLSCDKSCKERAEMTADHKRLCYIRLHFIFKPSVKTKNKNKNRTKKKKQTWVSDAAKSSFSRCVCHRLLVLMQERLNHVTVARHLFFVVSEVNIDSSPENANNRVYT